MAQTGEREPPIGRVGLPALFAAFFWLGIISFGGGTAGWLYRQIAQRRRWIDDPVFLSAASLSRIMPGPGGVNLTVQVGQRLRGGPDAVAAALGLLSGPLAIVGGLAVGYATLGRLDIVHAVLDGVAAAAIGLTFAAGLKLIPRPFRNPGPLAVSLATVVCVGVLRWPMLPVILSVPGAGQHRHGAVATATALAGMTANAS